MSEGCTRRASAFLNRVKAKTKGSRKNKEKITTKFSSSLLLIPPFLEGMHTRPVGLLFICFLAFIILREVAL